MIRRVLLSITLCVLAATRAAAQEWTGAEALLAEGRIAPAESLLFLAATIRPHDPEARVALGRYLGSRGALRVGAVLLEEARLFGADARRVARDLAPLYRALGDYKALATLPGSPLTATERTQAVWFVSHQPTLEMDDSTVLAYRESSDTGLLGRVTIRVGTESFDADIDARRHGIVLDASRRELAAELFASERDAEGGTTLGALDEVQIGEATLGNVPVTFEALVQGSSRRAVIGLDLLARLSPTFDAPRRRLVLRRSRIAAKRAGERVALLMMPDAVLVRRLDGFIALDGDEMRSALRGRAWTLDSRRGELLLEP
jgi:hypothetical protein